MGDHEYQPLRLRVGATGISLGMNKGEKEANPLRKP